MPGALSAVIASRRRTRPSGYGAKAVFERFTERARQVVVLAQDEARGLKHNYIGTEHILLGLFRVEEGLAARVLESLGMTVEEVRAQVARIVGQGDEVTAGQIPFTPRAKKVLELSLKEALSLSHNYIGGEHILLGLVRENEGVASRVLLDFGADAETIRDEVMRMLSGAGRRKSPKEPPAPKIDDLRWEYGVRTLAGPSDSWVRQLSSWRREGWELLSIVEEDGERRAILERRLP
jgi:ATP-dependent Clp protease ATP-binding subunit ClpA